MIENPSAENVAIWAWERLASLPGLEPVTLPDTIPVNALGFVLSVESAFAFDDLTRSRGIDTMQNSSWPGTFRSNRFVPAVEYLRAQRVQWYATLHLLLGAGHLAPTQTAADLHPATEGATCHRPLD